MTAGRSCPLHYRYSPAQLAHGHTEPLDVLYVVGGLYGNALALDSALAAYEQEQGRKQLVFNGDFHWFDADPKVFARIEAGVSCHTALRGNVETELALFEPHHDQQANDVGCGCAYPDWVDDATVQRSNRIMQRLASTTNAQQRERLANLPMLLRAQVGQLAIGLVHGDAESLAGWGFAQENLHAQPQTESSEQHLANIRNWFQTAEVDLFACSHTCLPVIKGLSPTKTHARHAWICNNGAAGMPNFKRDTSPRLPSHQNRPSYPQHGLLTRIATSPYTGSRAHLGLGLDSDLAPASREQAHYHLDLIDIPVDLSAQRNAFVQQWPEGCDAYRSYDRRITAGPDYHPEQVIRI